VTRGPTTVVGLDGRPPAPEVERLLADAALIAGGRRHLEMLGVDRDRAVVLEGDLAGALMQIEGNDGPVVVLASGDPGFFGIVRLLAGRFGRENLRRALVGRRGHGERPWQRSPPRRQRLPRPR
jgi:precorrin-6B C5,15-methyltransferase / cobalt-precorrin-6B C5,C15-methyltransferase